MLTLDIFLPPLLGGFIFAHNWIPLRYWTQREQGYKLVFTAAIVGGIFLAVAHLLLLFAAQTAPGAATLDWWSVNVGIENSERSLLAFLFGALLWFPANRLWEAFPGGRSEAVVAAIVRREGDPFEIVLMDYLQSQKLLLVTLKSQKAYVGRVRMGFNPAHGVKSIRLVLEHSGYRDPDTHRLHLTIDYAETHHQIHQALEDEYLDAIDAYLAEHPDDDPVTVAKAVFGSADVDDLGTANFEIAIPVREIQSLQPFEPEIFREYFEAQDEGEPVAPAETFVTDG